MTLIPINLNQYMLVAITEYGWEQIREKYDEDFISRCIKKELAKELNGILYYRLQIHAIITMFGTMLWMTNPAPLEMKAYLDTDFKV